MRAMKAVAAVAVLWIATASPASATTMVVTYTGSVTSAIDATGVFGTVGANLAGVDYGLVFTIDTTKGSYSTFNGTFSDPLLHGDQVFGGVEAALTIDGHTETFLGGPSSFDIVATKAGLGQLQQQVNSAPAQIHAFWQTTNPGGGFPTSVLDSFTAASCSGPACTSQLFFDIDTARGDFHGDLGFGTFSVTPVAATPIPATLPLLVAALGSLGFAGWRRGRQAA
ncbi:MAG: hypothetical protein ABUL54_03705 [Dongia sp.]